MLLLWRFITFNSLVIEEIKVLYSLLNKEELQNVEQVLLWPNYVHNDLKIVLSISNKESIKVASLKNKCVWNGYLLSLVRFMRATWCDVNTKVVKKVERTGKGT